MKTAFFRCNHVKKQFSPQFPALQGQDRKPDGVFYDCPDAEYCGFLLEKKRFFKKNSSSPEASRVCIYDLTKETSHTTFRR
jgi:hypothetical protein